MLERHRILLALIYWGQEHSERGISRTRLMKYAFLLSHEGSAIPKSAGYEFVPYKYGPFSFTLYHDLGHLQRDAWVAHSDESSPVSLLPENRGKVREQIDELPYAIRDAVHAIARRWSQMAQEDLLRDVYSRFPWYALNTERADLAPHPRPRRSAAPIAIYTVGYEQRSVDGLFNFLLTKGIARILDVRSNPVSRKYGFAGTSLRGIAEKVGVEYVHMPELGIESGYRKDLTSKGDYDRLLRWYEETLPSRKESVEKAVSFIKAVPSALLCMEADPSCCHRGRLAAAMASDTGLPVCHLTGE